MADILNHEETKDSISRTLISDGPKSTVFQVSGTIANEKDSTFDLLDLDMLEGNPKGMKLDTLVFSVESKLKLFLKYRDKPFIIPLEGRSRMEFGNFGGIVGKEIDLVCKGVGSFFLLMDVTKLGA